MVPDSNFSPPVLISFSSKLSHNTGTEQPYGYTNGYLFLQLKMTLEKLSKCSASVRSISLALIFMLKMFSY